MPLKLATKSGKPVTPSYASKVRNADEAMHTLRMEMHTWEPAKLAEAIGVSSACIYAVRSGRTKWPRPKTFFGLIDVLNLEMHLIKRD